MILDGYVNVPDTATVGGAPIDAFQANAFRLNDVLFEKLFQAVLSIPLMPNGIDGPINNPTNGQARQILNATTITIGNAVTTTERVPLIWLAKEKITINEKIDAKGKGAAGATDGDFGGSGGGGTGGGNTGGASKIPISGVQMLAGGVVGANGNNLTVEWASRAFSFLAACTGGAGGGNPTGGAGGGVVFLCAPEIEFGALGSIDVSGADGTGGGGGGGGGLAVLIAKNIVGFTAGDVLFNGGGGAGAGGTGLLVNRTF